MHKSIEDNAVQSISSSERQLEDDGLTLRDSLPIFASGEAAAGSLGLAAAATSLATTTTTFLVFIPVTTMSWPLFAVIGASALTLGYFSPQFLKWSAESLKAKYIKSLNTQINAAIFGTKGALTPDALCPKYLAQLDALCDQRLENLT